MAEIPTEHIGLKKSQLAPKLSRLVHLRNFY